MATFHHYGVPTTEKHENEIYLEEAKVHLTDSAAHPYGVEFLRFDADSPLPKEIQTQTHAGFMVDSVDEAIKGQKVILEPFNATDELRVAFIMDGGALIEVMETR